MTGNDLLDSLIYLVVVGLMFWLIWWFIRWVGLPEPFLKVAKVILGLAALVFLFDFLLGFTDGGGFLHFNDHQHGR